MKFCLILDGDMINLGMRFFFLVNNGDGDRNLVVPLSQNKVVD